MPSATATSEPGTPGAKRRSARITASESAPTSRIAPWVSPRCASTCHSCWKKSPVPLPIPSSFGTCPIRIVSASPTMKPFSTGSEMKFARKPSRSTPASSAARPVVIASAAVIATKRSLPTRHELGDGRRRQRRGRRHRPGHELARAAERRVQDQRAGRRVQADDRRDAGDRGVGERLGNEHRPDGQPGDQVAAQPRALVAAQGGEEPAHAPSLNRQADRRPEGLGCLFSQFVRVTGHRQIPE